MGDKYIKTYCEIGAETQIWWSLYGLLSRKYDFNWYEKIMVCTTFLSNISAPLICTILQEKQQLFGIH